jgi:flavorubredoxin
MTITEQELTATPYRIADDTYVIPRIDIAPPIGYIYMNSMVIVGKEPVIVDTGTPADRERWLKNVWNLVDPGDVRWIFLSHDDRDHAGNLMPVLAACPKATLLTTWFQIGRMAEEWMTPLDRCRFLRDGESFEAGDRTLTALRPPLFDNPTTRGLFDSKTGVYWSVDTFATNVPGPTEDAAELPDDYFEEGQLLGATLVAPWHAWLDESKWQNQFDRVQQLPIKTVAACHGPALHGQRIEKAFEILRRAPSLDPFEEYSQADLESWLEAMAGPPA